MRILVLTKYENSYTLQLSNRKVAKNYNLKYENSYQEGYYVEEFQRYQKREKVSLVDLADLLEVRYQTVADKRNGVSDFKFGEALLIKNEYFAEYDIEYLFEKEKEHQTT